MSINCVNDQPPEYWEADPYWTEIEEIEAEKEKAFEAETWAIEIRAIYKRAAREAEAAQPNGILHHLILAKMENLTTAK